MGDNVGQDQFHTKGENKGFYGKIFPKSELRSND